MSSSAEVVLLREFRRLREKIDPESKIKPRLYRVASIKFVAEYARALRCPEAHASLQRGLRRHFGRMWLHKVGVGDVRAWIARRIEKGTSRATINRNLSSLSRLFAWSIERGYAIDNPIRSIKRFRESRGRTRYLTAKEADALLAACKGRYAHLRVFVQLGLYTGGRASELLSLSWADVDLLNGWIRFRRETTKSAKERMVPLAPALADVLRDHRQKHPAGDDATIVQYAGRPLRSIRRGFISAKKEAGLGADVSPHVLRHSFASGSVMRGLDLYRLQQYLGHSDGKLTARYSHLSKEFLKTGASFIGPPKEQD